MARLRPPGRPTHRLTGTKEYQAWVDMRRRCDVPSRPGYRDYGGRGISYDPAWDSFETFLEDMGRAPLRMTLDRIDNDGGYSKENCRWATVKQQSRNRRSNKQLTHDGLTLTYTEWAERLGIYKGTIAYRASRGWPVEKILEKPNVV